MKPLGTIQVDCDGHQALLEYYGRKACIAHPDPAYETGIPRFLNLFDRYRIKATFFVIGRDALIPQKRGMIKEILQRGHEVANHSMNHFTGFSLLPLEQKELEILECDQVLQEVTGIKPVGFRAPGYDFDREVIAILEGQEYRYDSSLFPTFFSPCFRLIDRLLSRSKIAKNQFGKAIYGLAPLHPYRPSGKNIWQRGEGKITEVPISVIPFFRLPFHGTFTLKAGLRYFAFGLSLYRATGLPINYIFHALELSDPAPKLHLPPHVGNYLPSQKRMELYHAILQRITDHYRVVTTKSLLQLLPASQ